MDLEAPIQKKVNIGFECDVCNTKYRNGHHGSHGDEDWPWSSKGSLNYDNPDGEWESYDLCCDCFKVLKGIIEVMKVNIATARVIGKASKL